eukprot:TRINITY_DN73874_c0_g1_i1.p1 TRINITY_DN73874_c0_g1~~TRINITY_DN73874_c0_g1_i1.p1  ORF type:complete len:405 (+),score=93.78 TRINITY_DN73874_c0_g1_i1:96-1310(+)
MPIDSLQLEHASYLVQGKIFEVDSRYQIIEPMSNGSFGSMVCSARDTKNGQQVALKKIEGVFQHPNVTKRTLRELRFLRHLQHENLVQVQNVFIPSTRDLFEDIYVVCELMETDLASTLKSSQVLTDDHSAFFLYQILRGMKYVHSAWVIHRDLKPRNLLVNSNCDLKICDFGLARARFSDQQWVCPMTEYVCTRWYRAPEVLCSWTDYSAAIDIWSIGCILAEILIRHPIFPGNNTQHQLDLIIGLIGSPDSEELMKIPNEKCRKFIRSLPLTQGKDFQELFPNGSPGALDFLQKTLKWVPEARLTAFDGIKHPYLEKLHCSEDEPTREPLDTSDLEFERRKINSAALREEIFRETLQYYPELLEQFNQEEAANGVSHDICQYRLLQRGEYLEASDEDASDSD